MAIVEDFDLRKALDLDMAMNVSGDSVQHCSSVMWRVLTAALSQRALFDPHSTWKNSMSVLLFSAASWPQVGASVLQ